MSRHRPITGDLLARNTAANMLGQLIPVVVAAAALPLLARTLGADRLGLLSLVWTLITLFGDLGFGRAATKLAADALGRGEVERLAPVAWGTALVQGAVGVAAGAALAAATPLADRLMHVPPALQGEATRGFLLLAAGLPIIVLATAFRGMLEAAQRFGTLNLIRVPVVTAMFFLPLVALPLGWGLPGIVLLLLTARLASLAIYFVLAVRVFPELLRPHGIRVELPRVLRFGLWATVSTLVSPLLVYIDRFLLGALAGLAAVAYYTPPMEMAMRLLVVPGSATLTLFPAFSTLSAQRHDERLQRLVARTAKYVLLGIGPLLVVVAAGAHEILRLWLGPEFERQGALALQILTAGIAINSLGFIFFALVQGVGRPDLSAKFHMLELPIHALLAFLLIRAWGIPGAALAWALRVTLDTALLFAGALRASALSRRALAAERVPRTIGLIVAFAGLAAGVAYTLPSGLPRLAALTVLLLAAVPPFGYLALATDERARMWHVLQPLWAKRS